MRTPWALRFVRPRSGAEDAHRGEALVRASGRRTALSGREVSLEFIPVIGFEVHAQLSTRTKMFCGCLNETGGPPNSRTCPVCLGLPGALPVTNEAVVDMGVTVALALGARVSETSGFARKNYFYPDLPKGYQITQHEAPLATGGYLEVSVGAGVKRIRLRQIHVEEDAGKSVHVEIDGVGSSLLDMNRCGVPLLEIVTEPDISSIEEADVFLTELRSTLVYLGVASCSMHEGGLRFDTNVSLRRPGDGKPGTQTEIKNLNSFRSVRKALRFEIGRQQRVLSYGGRIERATLVWDEAADYARVARYKEGASDYRYFPEPDLTTFTIERGRVNRLKAAMPELPSEARARLIETFGVTEYDAGVLVQDPDLLALYERCVDAAKSSLGDAAPDTLGKTVANWVMVVLGGWLNERGESIADLTARLGLPRSGSGVDVLAGRVADVIALRVAGQVSEPAARRLFQAAMEEGADVETLMMKLGLDVSPDDARLAEIVRAVLEEHPKEVARYRNGANKLLRYFVGETMKRTDGKADPEAVARILLSLLSAGADDAEPEDER